MPTALKILGQQSPTLNTDVILYQVPVATTTVMSSLIVTNTSGTSGLYRVHCRIAGAAVAQANALAFDVIIGPNTADTWTIGITLGNAGTGDILSCRSNNGLMNFTLFGQENT
jgi:hypothetical protein